MYEYVCSKLYSRPPKCFSERLSTTPCFTLSYTENEDFSSINQTLIFNSSTTVQQIQIAIIDDEIIEVYDEHFSVIISNSIGEIIDTARVIIKENDGESLFL